MADIARFRPAAEPSRPRAIGTRRRVPSLALDRSDDAGGEPGPARQEAWVINLKRRPDRLEDFHRRMSCLRPLVQFQRFDAVDGRRLEMGPLAPRVNPWWREQLEYDELSGHLAIALSHLAVWEAVARSTARMVLICEDDAAFTWRARPSRVDRALRAAPKDADLVWLNVDIRPRAQGQRVWLYRRCLRAISPAPAIIDRWPFFARLARREQFWRANGAFLKTSEAYLISPAFARVLHDRISSDLGPVDIVMRDWIERLGARAYELRVPLFRQADWRDSDRDLVKEVV